MQRSLLVTALLTCAIAAPVGHAQQSRLPDMGSSAGTVLGPAQQAEYGQMLLAQLRHYDMVLQDPLLDAWLQGIGNRLATASDKPRQPFTFFWMRDRQINAFATLGGYVGMNAGLVLTADSEDEMASVLAHEIAHVTQDHVLRSVERAKRDSVPILLAMLGAMAIAQSAGGNSADDATMAAIASAQGLMIQRQIDYTRSNESEADRIGIQALARSGYDPNGAAAMFQRMQSAFRANRGGVRERTPDYLQTHPVTTTRIAEAKQNAEQVARSGSRFSGAAGAIDNPLLPGSLKVTGSGLRGASGQFGMARERLRVLSASTPEQAIREYEQIARAGKLSANQQYGLALAHLLDGKASTAVREFQVLHEQSPQDAWITLGLAQSQALAGQTAAADALFESILTRVPDNRAAVMTYAAVLNQRNTPASGQRAQTILRPLLASAASDPLFQNTFARASEIAGDPIRAGEAYAEAAWLNGRAEQALVQLNTLRKRDDLDYYARARIDARIAAITPVVLELQRQGVRDPDLDPNRR